MKRQVFNVCTSPAVQRAWEEGKPLSVHGFLFVVEEGTLVVRCRPHISTASHGAHIPQPLPSYGTKQLKLLNGKE